MIQNDSIVRHVPRSTGLQTLSALLLIMSLSGSAMAQNNAAEDDSTVVYPAAYFTEYSPITAKDMLDRIPGLGNAGGGGGGPGGGGGSPGRGGRGLGGGGGDQILVNGKRAAMSVQLEHRAKSGQIAILAVPLQEGKTEHRLIRTLWSALPLEQGKPAAPAGIKIDPGQLLPIGAHKQEGIPDAPAFGSLKHAPA